MTDTANPQEVLPEKPKHLVLKLSDAVRAIGNVEKSGRNEFQKYNYVKAADVAWIVRKALSERNIYLVCDVLEVRNYEIPAREGVMQAVDVKMQFSFFDGDAPDTTPIVLHSCGTGTDKGDKAIFKAQTGALKYGLRHAFLIPDESDPEADEETDKAVKAIAAEVEHQKRNKGVPSAPQAPAIPIVDETASLFYIWHQESQTAQITGHKGLMKLNEDLLRPLKIGKELVANVEQLEYLKLRLEERNTPFRPLKAV